MVVTRAGARKQEEEEKTLLQKKKDSQVRPSTLEAEQAEATVVDPGVADVEHTEMPQGCTLDDDWWSIKGEIDQKPEESSKAAVAQTQDGNWCAGHLSSGATDAAEGGPLFG